MKVIIFGATGMVGQGVLRECLLDPGVDRVLAVGRSPTGRRHEKLEELVVPDLLDLAPHAARLTGHDACFFCLGVSSAGLDEPTYRRLTHDLTLSAAGLLAERNLAMTLVYVSGAGTDSSEQGRSMWARVKGQTENALLRLPFKAAFMFRPALIQPLHGATSRTAWIRVIYALAGPVFPLLDALRPGWFTTSERLGRAMLEVARHGAPARVLESRDIDRLGRPAGGAPVELASITEKATLIDPSGRTAEQLIEHRTDPLTGQVASINLALGEKARAFLGVADLALLEEVEEKSRAGCPFCSAPEKGTRFEPGFAPEGQLRFGGALAMPNLFSKCARDSVVVLDVANHVLRPSRIGAPALANGIRAAVELVRRTRAGDPRCVHHLVGMNFLPPGGSSVPHPHFQVHVRGVPYSGVARLLERSAAWRRRTRRDYWSSLVESERADGRRYLGRDGPVEWLAAFAPSHQREVWGIVPGTGSLAELDEAGVEGLAAGLSRVLSFYEEVGAHPFTLAFLSSPEPGRGGEYALQVRACSRPPLKSLYVNYETWFGPMFAGDEVHTEAPEAYAARLRARW